MQTRQRLFDSQPDKRILSILLYIKGTTNQIGRILNKHNIRTILNSNIRIILKRQILRNPKDQRFPLSFARVYKIPCSCEQVYIEEIGRIVNLRIKEHQCDIRLKHATQSALSEYNIETRHQILFEMIATIVT